MPITLKQYLEMVRRFGPGWFAFRAAYAFKKRLGILERRTPKHRWDNVTLGDILIDFRLAAPDAYREYRQSRAETFFFQPGDRRRFAEIFSQFDSAATDTAQFPHPIDLADRFAAGRLRYFFKTTAETGFPPEWHLNPFTKASAPTNTHWSRIGDFSNGDIKIIWEPNRFAFAYDLVRAYWRTGDAVYPERYWTAFEDWMARNPPNTGANWMCGQEAAIRLMAMIVALYGFWDARATTPERVARTARVAAATAARIESNIAYAVSQNNNHGISEGMGLWTVGLLFPEFRHAARWAARGRRVLESEAEKLIYDDGGFSQHSTNYHRVMLHDYLWAIRLGDILGARLNAGVRDRVARAAEFLYRIQDPVSGETPMIGDNDGALLLPLNSCAYFDFRPVIQSVHYLISKKRRYPAGPWDEDLLWLFGPDALSAPLDTAGQTDFSASDAGCYVLRAKNGYAVIRCQQYRHRPAHADPLHMDIRYKGHPIAVDAGTYSYNAPGVWDHPLSRAAFHNTVTVDEREPMKRVSRFLWLDWLTGHHRISQTSPDGMMTYWEGRHDGYGTRGRGVEVSRGVLRFGDAHWIVMDSVSAPETHRYRLHWLIADTPYDANVDAGRIQLDIDGEAYIIAAGGIGDSAVSGDADAPAIRYSLVRADESTPRGWCAPGYFHREPALSFDARASAQSMMFWTCFGPAPMTVEVSGRSLIVTFPGGKADIALTDGDGDAPRLESAVTRFSDDTHDTIRIVRDTQLKDTPNRP